MLSCALRALSLQITLSEPRNYLGWGEANVHPDYTRSPSTSHLWDRAVHRVPMATTQGGFIPVQFCGAASPLYHHGQRCPALASAQPPHLSLSTANPGRCSQFLSKSIIYVIPLPSLLNFSAFPPSCSQSLLRRSSTSAGGGAGGVDKQSYSLLGVMGERQLLRSLCDT